MSDNSAFQPPPDTVFQNTNNMTFPFQVSVLSSETTVNSRPRCQARRRQVPLWTTNSTHSLKFFWRPSSTVASPNFVMRVAVFLASEDSAWLTGEQLLATGGLR